MFMKLKLKTFEMGKIKIYIICILISYEIKDFGPREDVIFKQQFFFLFIFLFQLLMFSAVLACH